MATLYYRANSANTAWNTLANWFQDAGFTTPAVALPLSTDDVVITFLSAGSFRILSPTSRTMASLVVNGTTSGSNATLTSGTFVVTGSTTINNNVYVSTTVTTNTLTMNNNSRCFSSSCNVTATNSITLNDNSFFDYFTNITTPLCIFNDNTYKLIGLTADVIFNDNSVNFLQVNGNATFSDNSGQYIFSASINGTINGNATLTNSVWNYRSESLPGAPGGYYVFPIGNNNITGTITFSSLTPVSFVVGNSDESAISWSLNSSGWIFSGGSPSWTFNTGSYLDGGNLVSNATFTGNSYYSNGTISGNIVFEDSSYNNGTLTLASGKTATLTENSFNLKTISGNVTYNGLTGENIYGYFIKGEKITYLKIPVTVSNLATFNNRSVLGLNAAGGGAVTLTGNASFKNSSINLGIIAGNATFINRSENRCGISGVVTITPDKGVNGSSILGVI